MIGFTEACYAWRQYQPKTYKFQLAITPSSWGLRSSTMVISLREFTTYTGLNSSAQLLKAFAGGHFSCTLYERPQMKLKQ